MAPAKKGTSKTSEAKSGKTRARHEDPITVGEPVADLPPRKHSSATQEVLDQIVAQKGSWVPLDTGGRQPNSVQSMISAAANKAGLDISVSVRGGQVFARAN